MSPHRVRAAYVRGGTSRALIFNRIDLPDASPSDDYAGWRSILLRAIGSPDPNGRQLDGMGGGISSLSKIAVVGASTRSDADVDYTFGQVAVDAPAIGYRGNCGNISAAIGPYAVDEGLVSAHGDYASVRIHNTNTGKIIVADFALEDGRAAAHGSFAIEGVAGTAAPIRLTFLDPAGAATGQLLPTGLAREELVIESAFEASVPVSLVDAANPVCFVPAACLGDEAARLDFTPDLLLRLRELRLAAAVRMGLAPDVATARHSLRNLPLVTIVSPAVQDDAADVVVRTISADQLHKASPLTGAMCLAAAAAIPGTVIADAVGCGLRGRDIRVRHPAGTLLVSADVADAPGGVAVASLSAYRTARRIMDGWIYA